MSHDHDHTEAVLPIPRINWSRPFYQVDNKPEVFKIFDGDADIPQGFNAACISLNGKMNGDLDWRIKEAQAKKCSENNLFILWNINLGLFNDLTFPLRHQGQYQSLGLALDHFRKTLWNKFEENTFGICLYRGPLDTSEVLPWDEEQTKGLQDWALHYFKDSKNFTERTAISIKDFAELTPTLLKSSSYGKFLLQLFCREITREYLELILTFLPEVLQPFVLLDCSHILNPLHLALLTVNERDRRIHSILGNSPLPPDGLGWECSSVSGFISRHLISQPESENAKIALCIPSLENFLNADQRFLEKSLSDLMKKKIPFRIIAEATLTGEWDGLDQILVDSSTLSPQGARMLRGFTAAGGEVILINE
jgi:hypothetical protein